LQERLPNLQLAAQGIQRLRKAVPDVLAKAADALSPRMIRIKILAADWRRLDERVHEVSTGDRWRGRRLPARGCGASGRSWKRLVPRRGVCGAKVSWLARLSGLADVSFLCIPRVAPNDEPEPHDVRGRVKCGIVFALSEKSRFGIWKPPWRTWDCEKAATAAFDP
jgi:hypothetical protein